MTYGIYLPDTTRIQLPYDFHSEWVPFLVSLVTIDMTNNCLDLKLAMSNSTLGSNILLMAIGKKCLHSTRLLR